MSRDRRKIITSIVSLIMVIALVLSLFSAVLIYAFAAPTQADANSLRSQISDISKEKEHLQKELDSISSEKKSVLEKKSALERKASLNVKEIDATDKLISELSVMIDEKSKQLSEAQRQVDEQYDLFLNRIKIMYKFGNVEYLDVLLGSGNFSEMQMRFEIISKIANYDKDVIRQLKASKQAVLNAKSALEADMAEQVELSKKLAKTKKELADQIKESDKISSELESDEETTKALYEEMEAEEEKLQAELKKIIAESSQNSSYIGGTMMWPLPGHTRITSPFGNRLHPTLKVYKLHTGIDIAAPKGTKILAANAGEVVISAYSKAWGEYVVINHGGGTATLYAHMSKRLVSKGDNVIQGQNIGLVGSTGYATGNHLHFEIQKNGTSVDPFASEFKK